MLTAIIAIIVLGLTLTAFILKRIELHAVSIIGWLVLTYFLVTAALGSYNTFIPTAVGLFGLSMVILHTVMIVMIASANRTHSMTYDEEKEQNRQMIYKLTKKKDRRWYE